MKKGREPFEVEIDTLGFFIHRAFYTMVKMLNKELKEHKLGMQHSDFAIMMILNSAGELTQTELANIQGKERSGISRSLKALEKDGYVERIPLDGKTNSVSLSQKGKEMMPLLQDIAETVTQNALKGFSNKSSQSIKTNLEKIYRNALAFINA